MGADPAARRLEHLLERYGLGARQRRQLDGLLSLLANDRHAPTSVRTPERAVDAHIADSLVALELEAVRAAESIADLGSGAGFPGLPLAIALEGSAVHLVESVARKCVFLERAIGELGLENARVVRGRAEEWSGGQGRNDVATARAVGPQPVVVEYAAPLLRTGGVLVDWRAGRAREQEQRGARAAAQVGMRPAEVRRVQPFVGARERHLHLYLKVTPTPAWLPRRPGAAVKRPLGAAPRPGAEPVPARASERAAEPARRSRRPVRPRTALACAAMGTVYAIANQKGGVGKTTTAVNVGACIAEAGYATLLVDVDPQANATVGLGIPRTHRPGLYEVLSGEATSSDAIRRGSVPSLHVLPAGAGLAGANVELPRIEGFERLLRERLAPVRGRFQYVLLDCPPSLGPLTVSALVAADKVIVPVQTEYFALEGLAGLLDTLALVQRELNPRLTVSGMLLTMHDDRTRLGRDVEQEVRAHFSDLVFTTVIPRNVRIGEAPSHGLPVTHHDPNSAGAEAYFELAKEVAARD